MRTTHPSRLNRPLSIIGLGTWQLGADWAEVSDAEAPAVLDAAVEGGATVVDTADVYGDGRSERAIGRYLRERPDLDLFVATKMGRRLPQAQENYTLAHFREWIDRSRAGLGRDTLDLVQLHCPPTAVITSDRVYDDLDLLVEEGAIAHYGVSVETVDQALAAIERPAVASVQIILNAFRLKPVEQVLPAAKEAGVAIIARVPLASGLLSGRYTSETVFAANDHRSFNRHGEAFDKGETFSGVDFEQGITAATEFAALAAAEGLSPSTAALAFVAQLDGVSTVIPGARSVRQATTNTLAGAVPPLSETFLAGVNELYTRRLKASVHPQW